MRYITKEKLNSLVKFMKEKGIDALFIADLVYMVNDPNLRYLSGHPNDAGLVVEASGEMTLFPWDLNIAKEYSEVDSIADLSRVNNNWQYAIYEFFKERFPNKKPLVGVNKFIPNHLFQLIKMLPVIKLYENPSQITDFLERLRAIKSDKELTLLRDAINVGNKIIRDIQIEIENDVLQSEIDFATLIFKKMREYGAEYHAFPTLVANTNRSHQYHAFPCATNQNFKQQGLAMIDFGVKLNGYCSDITVPMSFGKLSKKQKKMRDITIKAYEAAIDTINIGVKVSKIDEKVAKVINGAGFIHNTAVGHGLGLTPADPPKIKRLPEDPISHQSWRDFEIENGMVFTIEPAIYSKGEGGVRLENDIIIHNSKVEIASKSEFLEF